MKNMPEDDARKLKQLQDVPLLHPTIFTDGGPWSMHNMPCSVHSHEIAVFDIGTGIFHPSRRAEAEGWMLIRVKPWARKLIGFLTR